MKTFIKISVTYLLFFFFLIHIILFIYFSLHWVFVAARGLSLVVVAPPVAVRGLLTDVALLAVEPGLWATWSFSSCGPRA